eukprot:14044977-Ditylum_brightwellii.AAC.1
MEIEQKTSQVGAMKREAKIKREEQCGPMGEVVENIHCKAREQRLQPDKQDKETPSLCNDIDHMKIREKEKENVEDLMSTICHFKAAQTIKIMLV